MTAGNRKRVGRHALRPPFVLPKKKAQNRFVSSKCPLETGREVKDFEMFPFDSSLGKNSSEKPKTTISDLPHSIQPHAPFWPS